MATVTITRAEMRGDEVTVTGTVDGVERTARMWRSHLDTLPGRAAKVAYAAGLLRAQAPVAPVTIDLSATVNV